MRHPVVPGRGHTLEFVVSAWATIVSFLSRHNLNAAAEMKKMYIYAIIRVLHGKRPPRKKQPASACFRGYIYIYILLSIYKHEEREATADRLQLRGPEEGGRRPHKIGLPLKSYRGDPTTPLPRIKHTFMPPPTMSD